MKRAGSKLGSRSIQTFTIDHGLKTGFSLELARIHTYKPPVSLPAAERA